MPPLRSFLNFGESVARRLRLPEFGLSETLRGKLDPGQEFRVGAGQGPEQGARAAQAVGTVEPFVSRLGAINTKPVNLFTGAATPTATPTAGAFEGPLGPTGQSAGGITGAVSGAGAATGPDTFQQQTEAEATRVQSGIESEIGALPQTFSEIYAPIIQDLDNQLGALPGQRGELEGLVGSGAESRSGFVGTERERLLTGLGGSEEKLRGESKKTLRGIGESIGQQFKAANVFLGTKGAGDSSATGRASEAITKQGLRQQGLAKEQLQGQIADIEARRIDVQQLAEGKLQQIEANKQDQLLQIAGDFQNIQRQLDTAKATATSQELASIAQQESALQQEMRDRLSQLNQEVRGAQQATEQWNRDRNAQLEDFAARLATRGTFTGQEQFQQEQEVNLAEAQGTLDQIIASGIPLEEAYDFLENRYGVDLRGFIFPKKEEEQQEGSGFISGLKTILPGGKPFTGFGGGGGGGIGAAADELNI